MTVLCQLWIDALKGKMMTKKFIDISIAIENKDSL